MAHLHKSVATLRISGDDLVPQDVTAMLGGIPTLARTKGRVIEYESGRTPIAKFGQWHLEAENTVPEDLDRQVSEILGQLTNDLAVWSALSHRFDVDLFCGWFMEGGNEGVDISSATLLSLGQRGVRLGIDIYGSDNDA